MNQDSTLLHITYFKYSDIFGNALFLYEIGIFIILTSFESKDCKFTRQNRVGGSD
mgnify:FL=1